MVDRGAHVIRLDGHLDLATAPELRDRVLDALREGHKELQIDLSAVTFVDSLGVGVLIGSHRRAEHAGSRLVLMNPQPKVMRLLEGLGLDDVFWIEDASD